MLKTEIKLIIRNLKRNKVVSTINILGLTIGLTFVILAGRYVYTEITYDRFHENHTTISRVERKISGEIHCYNPSILHSWLKDNIPDIKHSTRIINNRGTNVLFNNSKFNIEKALIVDSDFFSIFSFKLLLGEIESFANDKFSVALSESLAYKIFGDKNPIGESIIYKDSPLTVRAVLGDPPTNSSLKFDLLLPISYVPYYVNDNNWGNNALQIFVETNEGIQRSEIQQKINTGVISVFKSLGYEKADNIQYLLNPLQDIYYSASHDQICSHGDRKYTFLLLSLSVLVLIIALINYTNSLIANAAQSLKGIGIKSVTGASKNNNIRHLILQSALPCLIATTFAVVLSLFAEIFVEQTLHITLSEITLLQILLIILGGAIFGAVVGIYPAIKLSSVKVSDSLKEVNKSGTKVIRVRSYLSVVQFAATIALIISLFTINRQVNFVFKQSVENFDEDIVLYMPLAKISQHKDSKIETIMESLKSLPEIKETSTCNHLPGDKFYSDMLGFSFKYKGEEKFVDVNCNWVGAEFPEVMGYNIVNGRRFDKALKSDNQSYIVNETFIKEHGIKDISKAFLNGFPIVGVIRDFHYNSLQKEIQPLAIQYIDHYQRRIVVRLASSQIESLSEVITKMDKKVDKIDNTAISDIQFLEQHVASLYEKEVKTSKVIFVLSVFSILISCMGLFAISLFITNNKTKEIGIRKVNGAKVSEILGMLNKDFIKWVAIAFVIACPIAWFAMHKWLENFAYKTTLSWWIFALAGVLALGIALLTVSWQSWRAATRNPVEALRYE